MNVSDQRKSKRFELRLPFELIREGNRPRQEAGETMNMSSAGVLFTSNLELEIGSPIEYFITLQKGSNGADGIRLHCMGKVVRRHDGTTLNDDDDIVAMAATLERYEFVRPDKN
jgi:PilZ domain-containing protein